MTHQLTLSRRDLLARTGCGFGLLALADLLAANEPHRAAQAYAIRAASLAQGQADHLPLHARWSFACGPV